MAACSMADSRGMHLCRVEAEAMAQRLLYLTEERERARQEVQAAAAELPTSLSLLKVC